MVRKGLFRSKVADQKNKLCNFKIVGDLLLRSTVKSIKKFVWDLKKSAMFYVWELNMNRP